MLFRSYGGKGPSGDSNRPCSLAFSTENARKHRTPFASYLSLCIGFSQSLMRTNHESMSQEHRAGAAGAAAGAIPKSPMGVDSRGPFPVPESISRIRDQLDHSKASLNGVQSPIAPSVTDFTRDEHYARKYYEGKDPQDFVREESRLLAIPIFDRKDLHRCLELLEAKKHLSNEQEEALKGIIDRKSTRLNSSHTDISRMPSSA